jgi:hypothetical protein
MKSAKLEWCLGDFDKANELLKEAVSHYADFPKVICERYVIEDIT